MNTSDIAKNLFDRQDELSETAATTILRLMDKNERLQSQIKKYLKAIYRLEHCIELSKQSRSHKIEQSDTYKQNYLKAMEQNLELYQALQAMVTSFHAVEYMEEHMRQSAEMARTALKNAQE